MSNKQAAITVLRGAVLAFLAVALGAFGSHALHDVLLANQREAVFQTANKYHFYHALGLLFVGVLQRFDVQSNTQGNNLLLWAGRLMLAGVLVFSSSLYVLAIFNIPWLGAITPIGGVLLLISWCLVIMASYRQCSAH